MAYYKWLAADGPVYGEGTYDLSGAWQPRIDGKLTACEHGYHVLTAEQVAYWRGDGLIEIEPKDIEIEQHDKCVCRTWRLVRRLKWTRQDMLDCTQADAAAASYAAATAANARCADADAAYAAYAANARCVDADAAAAAARADRARQRAWIEARIGEKFT